MNTEYRKYLMARLNDFKVLAEQNGLNVLAVALKGSQNYNLEDDASDVDANLVFAPTLRQMRDNIKVKLSLPFGEVTCHNLYNFAEVVAKGNPQWVEVCRTEFVVGDLSMFSHMEMNPGAVMGMFNEKLHAMSHRYPSRAHVVDQFGYDPKQVHHLTRLFDVLRTYDPLHKYHGEDRDFMMRLKRNGNGMSLEQAEQFAKEMESKMSKLYKSMPKFKKSDVDLDMLDRMVMTELVKNFK